MLKKKKFARPKKVVFKPDFFNKLNRRSLHKKKEDSLKFIFNKVISFLKQKFKETEGRQSKIKDLNLAFYQHYFGQIAEQHGIPIKCNIDYSLYNKTKNPLIPKSVSKKYIQRIKMNREFVDKIINYLERDFLKWFESFNSRKIQKKVFHWEQIMAQKGPEEGLKTIVTRINSRNNKLFWTLRETQSAIKISLNCLAFT